jgi:K+-sensing histidine kinase KdpD
VSAPADKVKEVVSTVEAAGHFRIYLGAAAGVGKTYAMLNEGKRRLERGTDVVIGFVETHGRPLTEALLEGFEVVPRKVVDYRGARFTEMDLDAVLSRRPKVALVDELAHTNVPGSGRHAKRWEDVLELLDAGIDVIWLVLEVGSKAQPHCKQESHRTEEGQALPVIADHLTERVSEPDRYAEHQDYRKKVG